MTSKSENEVPLYCSDEESQEEGQLSKKKRGESKNWIFVNKFSCVSLAEETVSAEKTWAVRTTHISIEGKKRFYRCNKVPRKGVQCAAEIYLLFEADTEAVLLYSTDREHNHDFVKNSYRYGICDETKSEINKLYDLHLKPKSIMEHLKKNPELKIPTKRQLYNYLADRRRIKYGPSTISLGELEKWIINHTNAPENENEVFVIAYYILESDPPSFRIVLSTKNLLKQCISADILHADATYKLIWQGYPVLIAGTTDKNRKFHPICLTVTTNECKADFKTMFQGVKSNLLSIFSHTFEPKILVCDAAKSIQNAFRDVFGKETFVKMCWAHAKKKICTKLDQTTEKNFRKYLLEDIDALQSATSVEVFSAASKLFLKKWKDQKAFVKYFKKEWLIKNPNWYLGAAPISPATNNALESFNRVIKDHNTLRERIPLARFLVVAEEMVNSWSLQATEEKFATQPELQLSDWTTGYQWAKTDTKIRVVHSTPDSTTYLIPGNNSFKINQAEKKFRCFDEYKKVFFSSWNVVLPNNQTEWITGCCDCPDFYRKFSCKHLIGLAIRLKYVTPPLEAKSQPLGLKRKRGRPTKARAALIIQ